MTSCLLPGTQNSFKNNATLKGKKVLTEKQFLSLKASHH